MDKNEAIKIIRSNFPTGRKMLCKALEILIPELKESEDERIRKELKSFFDSEISDYGNVEWRNGIMYGEIVAWLEKQGEHQQFLNKIQVGDELTKNERGQLVNLSQLERVAKPRNKQKGEQKPANKVEPKFKNGDYIVNEYGFIMQIDSIDGNMYGYHVLDGNIILKHDITKTEESCHLWSIQDAKDGDVLVTRLSPEGDWIGMYKESTGDAFKTHCYMSAVGEFVINPNRCKNHGTYGLHPATKEQRDILFQEMKEAGYEWDANRKELKKIEKKFVWSKENNRYYGHICEILTNFINNPTFNGDKDAIQKDLNWLMSVKESQLKSSWSEEDEKIISKLIKHFEWKDTGYRFTKEDCLEATNWLKSLKQRMKGK